MVKEMCIEMFFAAYFLVVKNHLYPKCTTAKGQLSKLCLYGEILKLSLKSLLRNVKIILIYL